MRSVTLQELVDWIDRNKHRTWHWPNFGKEKLSLEIKYLTFSLDTRDMTVWRLGVVGLGNHEVEAIRDTHDSGPRTILDELEARLDAARKTDQQKEKS